MLRNHIIHYILLSAFLISVTSCFMEDTAVPPYPGRVITIGNNINHFQSYFSFNTGLTVSSNPIDAWQLGFESDSTGWHIVVNSGDNWFLWNSHQNDINAALTPPTGDQWPYDIQSYYPDSTSTGDWTYFENGTRKYTLDVYVLAQYSAGTYIEKKHLVFTYVDSTSYRFFYRDEDSGISDSITIVKNMSTNFDYYDFASHTQVFPEPDDSAYDILFTPYYDLATQFGVTIPYLVRGVLLNLKHTSSVLDSVNIYDRISFENLQNYHFSPQRDIIGYRWKYVNVDVASGTADYTVRDYYTYIIRTQKGRYYKMRFLSFSLNGTSGFPQFDYTELKPPG